MADRAFLEQLVKKLADEGKLIAAGWAGLRILIGGDTLSPTQLNDMKIAYMAGASHLFSTMTAMMDAGDDETPADLRRMDLISDELAEFDAAMRVWIHRPRHVPPGREEG